MSATKLHTHTKKGQNYLHILIFYILG
jgi:hypothetical protein